MSSLLNLSEHILKGQVFALNNLKQTDPQNVFQGGPTLVCRSDADNQLILFVPFSQTVRLSAFSISGPKGDEQPTVVKMFVNRPALGFEDVADAIAYWYNMSRDDRKKFGKKGREWALSEESGMSSIEMSNRFVKHIDRLLSDWKPRESFTVEKVVSHNDNSSNNIGITW